MNIVMTLMVRDEADVIRAMLQHHRDQGIDHVIVTDNASTDGTLAILREFEGDGFVDITVDERVLKQQSEVVTAMARRAATEFRADWVINADADEFWVAVDPTRTVRDVLAATPRAFGSFTVPVTDMVGEPAERGSGLHRLVYQDLRDVRELEEVGLKAHSTPNAVHVGSPDVIVSQGNHAVSIPSSGSPAEKNGLEVLHLPWRSWHQFSHKVENAGKAYEANPTLKPSPNHHGMRDFRRLQAGQLLGYYLARHPSAQQIAKGLERGSFVEDRRLSSLTDAEPDLLFAPDRISREIERISTSLALDAQQLRALREFGELETRVGELELALEHAATANRELERLVAGYESRRVLRYADAIVRLFRRQ